jgi:hypothetical protein
MNEATEYIDNAQQSAAELADRYVALWNEGDPERRRELIEGLWSEDGEHVLQPPEDARRIAAGPGVGGSAIIEVRGHAEIDARATSAHGHWSSRRDGASAGVTTPIASTTSSSSTGRRSTGTAK